MLAEGRSHERRAGHYKDFTETGNRARKVSGTQGITAARQRQDPFSGPRRTQRINGSASPSSLANQQWVFLKGKSWHALKSGYPGEDAEQGF